MRLNTLAPPRSRNSTPATDDTAPHSSIAGLPAPASLSNAAQIQQFILNAEAAAAEVRQELYAVCEAIGTHGIDPEKLYQTRMLETYLGQYQKQIDYAQQRLLKLGRSRHD